MKKILLPIFILFISIYTSNAQFVQNDEQEHETAVNKNHEKTTFAGWYNYGSEVYSLGGNCPYYRSTLFPDSTVLREYSTGMGAVWHHSTGQVLDPTSDFHSFNGNLTFDEYNQYTLDSVGIFYRYWRHQQGSPDTLVLQVFDDSKITYSEDPWGNGKSYATVDYDYTTRLGANPTSEVVYILDNSDVITNGQGFLQFPVGLSVGAGEKVAVTFTYIPGNSFNVGDTIDQYMTVPPTNQINAFYYFYYVDEDLSADFGYYNNQVLATTSVRYNTNSSGWNGSYIPGTAWSSGIYHSDISFHITSDNVGVENVTSDLQTASLYPNPVENEAIIELTLQNKMDVKIELFDVSGKKIIDLGTQSLNAGTNQINVNTTELSAGVYYCKLTGDQSQSTLTFNKVK